MNFVEEIQSYWVVCLDLQSSYFEEQFWWVEEEGVVSPVAPRPVTSYVDFQVDFEVGDWTRNSFGTRPKRWRELISDLLIYKYSSSFEMSKNSIGRLWRRLWSRLGSWSVICLFAISKVNMGHFLSWP